MTNNIKYHVMGNEGGNKLDDHIGFATNEAEAMALYDGDGWKATGAYFTEIELGPSKRTAQEIEALYAEELESGQGSISRVYNGWVVMLEVICLKVEEVEEVE